MENTEEGEYTIHRGDISKLRRLSVTYSNEESWVLRGLGSLTDA